MLIRGEVRFRIECERPEAFINRLRYDIAIIKLIKVNKNVLDFSTDYLSKCTVIDLANKMNVKLNIIYQKGLPVIIKKYRKRTGLLIGAILSLFCICFSSCLIWQVRVEGNTYVASKDIVENLDKLGVSEGRLIDKASLEHIYNSFLIKEPRISWISVNYDGTIAHVEVRETERVPERVDRDRNINIVAKCDGVVKRIDALDGEKAVQIGETVSKGQLLISSFMQTRKTGVIMKAARGSVWAITERTYEIIVPKISKEKKYTSKEKKYYTINVLGKSFELYLYKNYGFKLYDKSITTQQAKITDKLLLPFKITTEKVNEYTEKTREIDLSIAEKISLTELDKRINGELLSAEIVNKNKEVIETDNEYVFTYKMTCIENIAQEKEFQFE